MLAKGEAIWGTCCSLISVPTTVSLTSWKCACAAQV